MAKFSGMTFRLVGALAIVFAVFVVLSELAVSSIVQLSVADLLGAEEAGDVQLLSTAVASRVRKPVILYMSLGAILALIFTALWVNGIAVRPLSRMNAAVETLTAGKVGDQLPLGGSREVIVLGRSMNEMIHTIAVQKQQLEQRLVELSQTNNDLVKTRDELVRAARLASVGTMASGIAHEIGNPIAGILGLLDAIQNEADAQVRDRYLDLIQKEVRRIDHTIRNLLDFARPSQEADTANPAAAVVAFNVAFARAAQLLKAQKLFSDVEISVNGDVDLTLAVDEKTLTGLLINLLLNAAQAMAGTGTVDVVLTPPPPGDRLATVAVSDSGPGVPDDIKESVFEPFISSRHQGGGSGLGLAICERMCEKYGGTIKLDSAYAGGARFVATLPVAHNHN